MWRMICLVGVLVVALSNGASDIPMESKQVTILPESSVKKVEDYVVAADFDHTHVAQLMSEDDILNKVELSGSGVGSDNNPLLSRIEGDKIASNKMNENYPGHDPHYEVTSYEIDDHKGYNSPSIIHNDLGTQRSVLAVGFILFLLLLSTIQGNMMTVMATKRPSSSLLGGVTQALGKRRKRTATQIEYRTIY